MVVLGEGRYESGLTLNMMRLFVELGYVKRKKEEEWRKKLQFEEDDEEQVLKPAVV